VKNIDEKIKDHIDKYHKTHLLAKIFLFILSVLIGSVVGALISSLIVFNYTHLHIEPSDSIAVANTYIFFISIIFILFTIAVTIIGYFYTKERAKEIHQFIIILGTQLETDDGTRKLFIDEIFKNNKVKNDIISKVKGLMEEEKRSIIEETPSEELEI